MVYRFALAVLAVLTVWPAVARADRIADVVTWPAAPAVITPGTEIRIQYYFLTEARGGARIFARPMKDGALASGYSASGSQLYRGEGQAIATFTLDGPGDVDAIRFQVVDENRRVRHEHVVPARFRFARDPLGAPGSGLPTLQMIPGARLAPQDSPRAEIGAQVRTELIRPLLERGLLFRPSPRIPDVIELPGGEMQPYQTLMGPPPPYDVASDTSAWAQEMERWIGFMSVMMLFDIQRLMGDDAAFDAYRQREDAETGSVYEVLQYRRNTIGNLLDAL